MNEMIVLNLFATSAMFGIIWMVQLVHYPMFQGIHVNSFQHWHRFHSNKITFIVAPLMICELILSVLLCWSRPETLFILSLVLTVAIWLTTFGVSVPLHNRLAKILVEDVGERDLLITRLIRTNWSRTILYSVKVAAALLPLVTQVTRRS